MLNDMVFLSSNLCYWNYFLMHVDDSIMFFNWKSCLVYYSEQSLVCLIQKVKD